MSDILSSFKQVHIPLRRPLLMLIGGNGVLACGYLNVETFEKTGEAAAIVTGVASFDDMCEAKVMAVSSAAAALGVQVGMPGRDALWLLA